MAYNNNHPPNINQGYAGNPPQAYYGNAGQQVNLQMPPPPPGSAVMWMPRPQPIPGCPPGLEYLTSLDRINVKQLVSLLEVVAGWDTNNKYVLFNSSGQQFLYAMEESDTCMRICCGAQRGFTFHIVDNLNQEVMRITREFKCCAGCCWFAGCCDGCAYEVTVEAPPGQVIGQIKQGGSFWKANYDILDENGQCSLKIEGPCCVLDGPCCPFDQEFIITSASNGSPIGKISKKYAGFVREAVSMADQFGIEFPVDLSVKAKGTLIGALLLIDFMFFEKQQKNDN